MLLTLAEAWTIEPARQLEVNTQLEGVRMKVSPLKRNARQPLTGNSQAS